MKRLIINIFNFLIKNYFLFKLFTFFKFILDNNIYSLKYNNLLLKFYNNSWITNYRYKTFAQKEPETLDWINKFDQNSVFWDIGANIGLYSIYAAKLHNNIKIYSFEPSPFNLELLVKNININNCKNIILVPVPLSESTKTAEFKLSNTTVGGALSVFAENYDQNGNQFSEVLSFQVIGSNIDNIISHFNLLQPDYIKIDVDGIEHLIINGGIKTIDNCKSILVEINKDFPEQYDKCKNILSNLGFKKLSIVQIGPESTNQIWIKK